MKLELNRYLKRSLKNLYWRQGQRVLAEVQKPVLDLAGELDVDSLKRRVPFLLRGEPVEKYQREMWVKGGSLFALDTVKRIHKVLRKQEEDIDFWEDYFRRYVNERALLKTGQILTTQEEIINNLIDGILEEGFQNGQGIPEIQRAMRGRLTEALTDINKYQAERIARTEINGAANTGSFEGAWQTGVALGKEWITSGLKGIRESHLYYESLGNVKMDYQYNTGLRFPGESTGPAEEIINCRCVIGYIVDE